MRHQAGRQVPPQVVAEQHGSFARVLRQVDRPAAAGQVEHHCAMIRPIGECGIDEHSAHRRQPDKHESDDHQDDGNTRGPPRPPRTGERPPKRNRQERRRRQADPSAKPTREPDGQRQGQVRDRRAVEERQRTGHGHEGNGGRRRPPWLVAPPPPPFFGGNVPPLPVVPSIARLTNPGCFMRGTPSSADGTFERARRRRGSSWAINAILPQHGGQVGGSVNPAKTPTLPNHQLKLPVGDQAVLGRPPRERAAPLHDDRHAKNAL